MGSLLMSVGLSVCDFRTCLSGSFGFNGAQRDDGSGSVGDGGAALRGGRITTQRRDPHIIVKVVILFVILLAWTIFNVWFERRALAKMQSPTA
jgi:hypothetical protein